MLVLTRRCGETIIIADNIRVTVLGVQKNQIRLGIDAPKEITINREEIQQRILDNLPYAKPPKIKDPYD